MLTKKIWLLAVSVAVIAIQGCGGGGGLLSPGRTPTPANTPVPGATPIPGVTATPVATAVPGNTPMPGNTPVPTTVPPTGDNIGVFSDVAPTNGQNDVDSASFVPTVRTVSGDNQQIDLQQRSANVNRIRSFQFSPRGVTVNPDGGAGLAGGEFVAGKSYSLARTGSNRMGAAYIQQSDVNNTENNVWTPTAGTFIVDSVTRDSNNFVTSVKFRVVDAQFAPQPTTLIGNNSQGTFTFNFSGTAVYVSP